MPCKTIHIAANGKISFFKKFKYIYVYIYMGFPDGSDGKESTCNVGDLGLIPELGRSPGEENGNQL